MLTIDDVSSKRFSSTKKGDGYEIAEVHQFVGDVYETLVHRDEELADLRAQLDEALRVNAERDAEAVQPAHDDPVRESSASAVRLLEIATLNAEQLVTEARTEASGVVATARVEADHLVTSARDEAERVTGELARSRKQQEDELDAHRTAVLGELADRRSMLQTRIDDLETLERDSRNRLRTYFSEQLAQLEGVSEADTVADAVQSAHADRFEGIDAVA